MTVTKRTLERWRREALTLQADKTVAPTAAEIELCKRILRLTGELLDQHLMGRKE